MIKKNIFIVCYGGGHINLIEPIVDELIKDKNFNVKLLALTTAYNKVKDKYDCDILKSLKDYIFLFDENIDEIFKNAIEIFDDNYNLNSGLSKLEVLTYLGCSYTDNIKRYGLEKANMLYSQFGRQSFLPINTIQKILNFEKTDVLITTKSPRFEKASLYASKNLNIKSIQIINLFDDDINEELATYTIVMNEFIRNTLIRKGFNSQNIFAFGQPAIEQTIKEILKIDLRNLYKRSEKIIKNDKKNLIYFTQRPLDFNNDGSKAKVLSYNKINPPIFKLLNDFVSKYNVFIRLHPNEDINDYKEFLNKYPNMKILNDEFNLYETIAISDIVLTSFSTVALEANACGKTILTFKYEEAKSYPIKYFMNKPYLYAENLFELSQLLSKSFINKEDSKNIFDQSTLKITDFIKKI